MMVYGEQFVAVAGTDLMQMLFADSLGSLALVNISYLAYGTIFPTFNNP